MSISEKMCIMYIEHSSCCDLVEQKVNFWFTNSVELVIERGIGMIVSCMTTLSQLQLRVE